MAESKDGGQTGRTPGRQISYKSRGITIVDDDAGAEVRIDGVHVDVTRLAAGRYYSHTLPFQEYTTAEELAKALVDTEGTLWRLAKTSSGGHPGDLHG